MKLQKLKLAGYKNLRALDLDLSAHNGLTVLIGNNASGKSNFLEAISELFYHQYKNEKAGLACELRYNSFAGQTVTVNADATSAELPRRVVAVYSGEEDRLWKKYYEAMHSDYIRGIHREAVLEFPKMLYLSKDYWQVALLCLLCSEAPDVQVFVKNKLGIHSVQNIRFTKTEFKFKDSAVKAFVDSLATGYSFETFQKEVDKEELFLKLYIATTDRANKLITDIAITFNGEQTLTDLSEGQKKQLLIQAALEYSGGEDTLFLFDEPDAHIHLSNKKSILEIITPYADTTHIILTTHSPTLCSSAPPASIVKLQDGGAQPVADELEGARYLADSADIMRLLFSSNHIVLVEGKTDDKYISRAAELFKDEFPELHNSLDFLRLGGSDSENVRALLDKIEEPKTRKIIILSDRDKPGHDVYRNLFEGSNKERKDVLLEKIPFKSNTYYLMIPTKGEAELDSDFVIEDYFSRDLIKTFIDKHYQEKFSDSVSFKNFPNSGTRLKSEMLPNHCPAATSDEMEGFKVLLSKLQEIVALPLD